ncbi:MAG: hypothetical protein QW478_15860 [Candidatus Micrarchaeaceae archaeon]
MKEYIYDNVVVTVDDEKDDAPIFSKEEGDAKIVFDTDASKFLVYHDAGINEKAVIFMEDALFLKRVVIIYENNKVFVSASSFNGKEEKIIENKTEYTYNYFLNKSEEINTDKILEILSFFETQADIDVLID